MHYNKYYYFYEPWSVGGNQQCVGLIAFTDENKVKISGTISEACSWLRGAVRELHLFILIIYFFLLTLYFLTLSYSRLIGAVLSPLLYNIEQMYYMLYAYSLRLSRSLNNIILNTIVTRYKTTQGFGEGSVHIYIILYIYKIY